MSQVNITVHDAPFIENKVNEFIILNDSTHRFKDSNGHLIVKDNPVAVAGVFPFLRGTVDPGCPEGASNEVVYVHRSEESLRDATHMFRDKPIVHNHTWVGKDGERNHADGHIGSRVYYKDGGIYGDLIIYNPDLINAIESGTCTQLSAGYNAKVIKDSGVYDGQSYSHSIIYTSINHLGVVEQGRAGVKLSIRDGKEMIMDNNNVQTSNRTNKGSNNSFTTDSEVVTKSTKEKETNNQKEGFKTNQKTRWGDYSKENLRSTFNNCIQKMKRGEMTSDQMKRVMDGFQKRIDYNIKGVNLLSERHKEFESKLKNFESEQAKVKARDKAVREIQEYVPSWRAYDNSDATTQYSRFYTYLTKQKLPDGMDARTASLTIARQTKQKPVVNKVLNEVHEADTVKKVEAIDALFNNNYHRFVDINNMIRRV